MNKKVKNILTKLSSKEVLPFVIVFLFALLFIAGQLIDKYDCSDFKRCVDQNYRGVVSKVYVKRYTLIDIKPNVGKIFTLYHPSGDLIENAKQGDSVIKLPGLNKVILKRDKLNLEFEYYFQDKTSWCYQKYEEEILNRK